MTPLSGRRYGYWFFRLSDTRPLAQWCGASDNMAARATLRGDQDLPPARRKVQMIWGQPRNGAEI
jgi:hypothetical protein